MFGTTFYHSLIRKYVILFGTLFNDISIIRTNTTGTTDQVIKVPLQFAPKEKMLARLTSDANIDRPYAALLPRMSFEYTGFNYRNVDKLQTITRMAVANTQNNKQMRYQYVPVPWEITWNLYVYAKHTEDANKIIEQILPYFTPAWTTTIEVIPEMNITKDIPVTLTRVDQEDNYDDNYKERRMIVWTLSFVMKAYFYGPVKQTGIIKIANTPFYIVNTAGDIQDFVGNNTISTSIVVSTNTDANNTTLLIVSTGNTADLAKHYTLANSSNQSVINSSVNAEITHVINTTAFRVNSDIIVANGTANIEFYRNHAYSERVQVTPGLDANDNPVNFYGAAPANTTSVARTEINAEDDFGYITEVISIEDIDSDRGD